ncbi:MAG TPA: acyl-CoA dehydrogenase family protein [Polyangiaceae bacterium]|nr:acyl-CoA dehydrogenase family protein [Polyangiaceae bacterium]
MDFELSPELKALRARVRDFMDTHVLPVERELFDVALRGDTSRLAELRGLAKAEGLFVPHLPKEHGGLGLGVLGMCALFREMGRSLLGASIFNCDAPDQGNMDLLLRAASPALRDRYFGPLARGESTSAFCMTEPAPGAGADPSNLRTTATLDGDSFVIEGHKWYSTGAFDAAFLIVMARTSDDPRRGATMFLVDRAAEGVEYVRDIPCLAPPLLAHREGELKFHGVRVGPEAVLGEVGQGFQLAQARLVPARLTHCMRWLGLADRVLHMCKLQATTRRSFGKELVHHQLVQKMFADNATAIHVGNLLTWHGASLIDKGLTKEARPYSSMAKNHVAKLLCQVLDDAIQLHGGLGYSDDVPFAMFYRYARAARIADGPDAVHDVVVARDFLRGELDVLV